MKKNKEVNEAVRNFFEKFFEIFKFQFIGEGDGRFFVKKLRKKLYKMVHQFYLVNHFKPLQGFSTNKQSSHSR